MNIGLKTRLDHNLVQKDLSAYLDGRVGGRKGRRIERHLEACSACREELESLRMTVGLLRQLPVVNVPRSFTLPASAQAEQARYRRWNTAYGALRTAAIALSFVLVALLSGDALIGSGLLFPQMRSQVRMQQAAPAAEMLMEREAPASPAEPLMPPLDGRGAGPEEAAPAPLAAEPQEEAAPKMLRAPQAEEAPPSPDVEAVQPAERTLTETRAGEDVRALPRTFAAQPPAPAVAEEGPRAAVAEGEAGPPVEEAVTEESVSTPAPAMPRGGGEQRLAAAPTTPVVEPSLTPQPTMTREPSPTPLPASTPAQLAAHTALETPTIATRGPAALANAAPLWDIWRAIRLGSGIALGVLLMLFGGLIWARHKRQP